MLPLQQVKQGGSPAKTAMFSGVALGAYRNQVGRKVRLAWLGEETHREQVMHLLWWPIQASFTTPIGPCHRCPTRRDPSSAIHATSTAPQRVLSADPKLRTPFRRARAIAEHAVTMEVCKWPVDRLAAQVTAYRLAPTTLRQWSASLCLLSTGLRAVLPVGVIGSWGAECLTTLTTLEYWQRPLVWVVETPIRIRARTGAEPRVGAATPRTEFLAALSAMSHTSPISRVPHTVNCTRTFEFLHPGLCDDCHDELAEREYDDDEDCWVDDDGEEPALWYGLPGVDP